MSNTLTHTSSRLDNELVMNLLFVRKQLLKETYDFLNIPLDEEEDPFKVKYTYKNYMGTTNPNGENNSIVDGYVLRRDTHGMFGDTPARPISSAQAKANGRTLISILMSEFGFEKFQAAAFAGVFMAESGLNPSAYNKEEYSGRGVAGQSKKTAQLLSKTSGYGAGIAQWTFKERKSKAVGNLNKNRGTKYDWRVIEWNVWPHDKGIPFDDQVRMVGYELQSPFIQKMKEKTTLEDAVHLVLAGYENGGGGSGACASIAQLDKYTWAGGYRGLMDTRVGYAKTFLADA